MIREMLRKKQLLSKEATEELLNKNTNGVMAVMGDNEYPYGVPLSYVYYNGKIYFHSGRKGYKVECISRNPKVSFTVVDTDQIVEEEYTTYFRSVIAMGSVRLTEGEEHLNAFLALTEKYSGSIPKEMRRKEVEGCKAANIYAIDIEHLTGKRAIEFVRMEEK